ncbi:MAG TPA: hypothetical protein VGG30_04820, partial [Pirellulales bacterium]
MVRRFAGQIDIQPEWQMKNRYVFLILLAMAVGCRSGGVAPDARRPLASPAAQSPSAPATSAAEGAAPATSPTPASGPNAQNPATGVTSSATAPPNPAAT